MFDINIVFVNYNCKEDIFSAIQSVDADIVNCPFSVKMTVVDNSGNADGIEQDLLKQFPAVHYLNASGNIGFGQGNTVGFKANPARYYFALNRDTSIAKDSRTIERIVRFMDEHPRIGCIGPKLVNADGTLQYSCYRFDVPSILIKPLKQINWDKKYAWVKKYCDRLLMTDFDHASTRPVDWVLGAAMVVRAEVVADVGWFDPRFFMYFEDCDWCHSMWEKNWPVYYVHDILIQHRYARESAKVPGIINALFRNKLARYHAQSWLKYLWKWRANHRYYAHLL